MSLLSLVAVSIGGALGALCRNISSTKLKRYFHGKFPFPTLIINIVSCTCAGLALYAQVQIDHVLYLALTMGFLGGFSTLSTMNYEAVELIMQKQYKTGIGYLAVSYASTLGAAALGYALMTVFLTL